MNFQVHSKAYRNMNLSHVWCCRWYDRQGSNPDAHFIHKWLEGSSKPDWRRHCGCASKFSDEVNNNPLWNCSFAFCNIHSVVPSCHYFAVERSRLCGALIQLTWISQFFSSDCNKLLGRKRHTGIIIQMHELGLCFWHPVLLMTFSGLWTFSNDIFLLFYSLHNIPYGLQEFTQNPRANAKLGVVGR